MKRKFNPYSGRWIALIDDKVVGQGGTPDQALQAAAATRYKEIARVIFVPTKIPLNFSPYLHQIFDILPNDIDKYLVGGAIRDALLGRTIHDYDLILSDKCLELARRVADRLGGIFFLLDEERETARVILRDDCDSPITFDFSRIRGNGLESDLQERDFTINAIASSLDHPQKLLDPLAGSNDLSAGVIRACSNTSMMNDPVRILRGIRLAACYDFKIEPKTKLLTESAVPYLSRISPERIRDELFRILDCQKAAKSILALELLGTFPYILPDLIPLKEIQQSAPHIKDVWNHTLDTLHYLEILLDVLQSNPDDYNRVRKGNDGMEMIFNAFLTETQEFRQQILDHIGRFFVDHRTTRSLIFFAALYHDAAKPAVKSTDEQGKIRFLNHEEFGSQLVERRGSALRLSNDEIIRLKTVVKGHMRPTHLARLEKEPSLRSIYRFFRAAGESGIDICLLSLADLLATYGPTIPEERWNRQLRVVSKLMDAWWKTPEKKIKPKSIIRGGDLLNEFNLVPGPIIGKLLEMVREEQVVGNIKTRQDAIQYVRKELEKVSKDPL